jgi:hypothetical protein
MSRFLTWKNIAPPAGWKLTDLFHKKIHVVNFFVKKKTAYHAAAGESGHYWAQTPNLQTYRVSPVSDTSYAVTNLKGNFASGMVKET